MSTEDKMNINERRKYLRLMQKRYHSTGRKKKKELLDEMEKVTKLHRKSLIRLMNSNLKRRPRKRQRGKTYGPEVTDAIRIIAESLDHICAERLTPNLGWMARHLASHGELRSTPLLLEQLGLLSLHSFDIISLRHQHKSATVRNSGRRNRDRRVTVRRSPLRVVSHRFQT